MISLRLLTLPLVLLALSLSLFVLPVANAASSFTLFGRFFAPAGWGSTSTTVTSPGPTLVVFAGDSVTVSLASADGNPHNWGVDYNGDGNCETGEPCAPTFGSSQVSFPFTATLTPGNYTYWCFIHKGPMFGTFTVKAQPSVGGALVPVDKLALLAPYVGAASIFLGLGLLVVLAARKRSAASKND